MLTVHVTSSTTLDDEKDDMWESECVLRTVGAVTYCTLHCWIYHDGTDFVIFNFV